MTDLNVIVTTLTVEEQQQFVLFLKKKNKRNDTKNIQLFKLLQQNKLSSAEICKQLYSNKKNAYHALRKRLYNSLIDFIANINLEEENSVDMQIIKYILASRSFLHNKHYKVAYKILDKAEVLAEAHYLFAILNEIYHTKIQYAYAIPEINISNLITQFKSNQKNLLLEDQLNIVYAKMRQTLNNITYKGDVIDIETLLKNTLQDHKITITESLSFKSLYQLITLVSIPAFVTNDYLKTEPFIIKTYAILKTHKSATKQLFYHIEVLFLIANTLFRNKKFNDSLHYLKLMETQMLANNKKYYNTFKLKHQFLLALNTNYSNQQDKAIGILEQHINSKHSDIDSLLKIHLGLSTFYIQGGRFKDAQQIFSKFYHTDKYYESKAGKDWVIKKNLIEIILHIELNNINLVESRLLSFKRNYFKYLKQINQHRAITYLSFIELYYKNPSQLVTDKFKAKVENSFEWVGKEKEDIFVMSFYAWLKSKMENKPLYKTTLEMVQLAKED
ncbi:hypothetical protein Celly_0679 [Cellulophaga lytica DSM 7489]|uniref:Uncharacterized protein n=1 Tax=Cellulophaga lytica (strain ATCC 23178 / DSM 7489 / JCM 8516 / NBRC 14961 / NCIMB 1423 / VKM B-1433 / Cy l20) TaxID=867900 RepID=F0RBB1_CELLC|nr:hypothetical protein [Cellulophaga lytica]ADY28513.1 hypothetical protein Celly_0679 [Cellulophaga lytica DSM 7489]WQG77310.1 hypothetical protein SR888_16640 [Cellulophaga lytica]